MDHRTRRSPARFLAPLALIVALIAFMMVVSDSGGGSDSGSSNDSATTTTKSSASKSSTSTTAKKAVAKKKAKAKTYTVVAGDTFGAIASKTGVTVEQLQELNPNADPRALQTGQTLRVK